MRHNSSKFLKVKDYVYISKDDPDFAKKYLSEHPDWQRVFQVAPDIVIPKEPPIIPNISPDYFDSDEEISRTSVLIKKLFWSSLFSIILGVIIGITYKLFNLKF